MNSDLDRIRADVQSQCEHELIAQQMIDRAYREGYDLPWGTAMKIARIQLNCERQRIPAMHTWECAREWEGDFGSFRFMWQAFPLRGFTCTVMDRAT